MDLIIKKSEYEGIASVPSSKSLSHRAIIAASLAKGSSVVKNVTMSNDILMTIEAMRSLGSNINIIGNDIYIEGSYPKRINDVIDSNESGSTLRFIIPIAMLADGDITFIGKDGLSKRPLEPYYNIFNDFNIKYESNNNLPLAIKGRLRPGVFNIRGDISSQFITGLLFALPLLAGNSTINITTRLESRGYIDLTLDILNTFGIKIINNNYKSFIVLGNQSYRPREYVVEGDYSQAAFFLCMDALGSRIKLRNMNRASLQGDKAILDFLAKLGVDIIWEDSLLYARPIKLKGSEISLANSPDLGPALATLMAMINDRSLLYDAERLRIKESDRIRAMSIELNKIGAKINEEKSSMEIFGVNDFDECSLSCHNDHRIAMSLAMLSIFNDIRLKGYECVNKSYPSFFKTLIELGGKVIYE